MSEVTVSGWGEGIRLREMNWRTYSPLIAWWCHNKVEIYFPLTTRPRDTWISLFKVGAEATDTIYLSLRLS